MIIQTIDWKYGRLIYLENVCGRDWIDTDPGRNLYKVVPVPQVMNTMIMPIIHDVYKNLNQWKL